MPLAAALAALELRPHLAAHGDALLGRVGLGHLQPEEGDERRVVEHLLQLGIRQRFRLLAHGVTTILPNTSRSSITRSASRASSSLKVLSTSTLSLPLCTSSSSFSMSVRIQPLEPSTLSSKVQMKRMSSLGSKPAVAPQVSSRPPTLSTRSDFTQVSPPV